MRRLVWAFALAVVFGVGCAQILGDDFTIGEAKDPVGGGGAGAALPGGGGAGEGAGGAGGMQACTAGQTESCYGGPAGTVGVGICLEGSRICQPNGFFGPCEGEVTPAAEICANGLDEDCDGNDATATACLSDVGLVVRYFIDEVAAGMGALQLNDSAPNPVGLDILYDSQPSFVTHAGGRGLHWGFAGAGGVAFKAGGPTQKVYDALNGTATLTLEVVAQLSGTATIGGIIAGLRNPSQNSDAFVLKGNNLGSVYLGFNQQAEVGRWENIWGSSTPARVFHVVLDTSLGTENERLRLYVDGAAATPVMTASVAQNQTQIFAGGPPAVVIGNAQASGGRSIFGTIYYMAIYSVALSSATVSDHAALLAMSHDGP
jgi:hypothetical protein